MKKILIFAVSAAIALLVGAALYRGGNYTAYNLTYIFSFLFIACYAVFASPALPDKIVQVVLYALIMTAQILFNTLVIRTMGQNAAYDLYRLLGVLVICVPYIVRIYFFHES